MLPKIFYVQLHVGSVVHVVANIIQFWTKEALHVCVEIFS